MDNKLLLNSMDSISPLISIIVPVYKVENYLRRAVDSILRQTYTNIEVILVDDGSPDECPRICDEYAEKDCRVKVVHKPNGGLSDARNAALDIINGEYVTFVDSDDYISDEMIYTLVRNIIEYKCDIVCCGVNVIDHDGIVDIQYNVSSTLLYKSYDALKLLFEDKFPKNFVWNKIYRSNLFKDIRYPINRHYEDIATTYKIFSKTDSVLLIPECLYFYELNRPGNITSELQSDKALNNMIDLIKSHEERCSFLCQNSQYTGLRSIVEKTLQTWYIVAMQTSIYKGKRTYLHTLNIIKEGVDTFLVRKSPSLSFVCCFPNLYFYLYPLCRKVIKTIKRTNL